MSQAQTRIEEIPEEGLVEQGLDLAPNLQLPIDACTTVIGIVAQRGADKS